MAKHEVADYSDVDIESLLSDEGIPYKTSGKNISAGWIGVCCPFCGEQNYHCGINLDSKRYSCWVCTQTGTLLKYVSVAAKTTYSGGRKILEKYRGFHYEAPIRELADSVIFPDNMGKLTKHGKKYLTDRGFNPDFIEENYGLQETNIYSKLEVNNQVLDFRCRLIIPIIVDREIVTYTGRDWTGQQDPRYRNAPLEAGTMQTSECLYNFDSVQDKALFVEGATDVWKLGKGAVGTLGVKFSHNQINRIVKKNLKKAVILFDSGAKNQAILLAEALGPFIPDIEVFVMTNGLDPGGLDFIDAHKLKMDLLGW